MARDTWVKRAVRGGTYAVWYLFVNLVAAMATPTGPRRTELGWAGPVFLHCLALAIATAFGLCFLVGWAFGRDRSAS